MNQYFVLTVAESHNDLRICPLTFLVFVVRPLYNDTPDTPSSAATALISGTNLPHCYFFKCIKKCLFQVQNPCNLFLY